MIGLTRAVRVFAYTAPTDMRRSYNGLESLVRRELGHDIMDGDLFLFINRRRDHTTLCILSINTRQRESLAFPVFGKVLRPSFYNFPHLFKYLFIIKR
jgi:hypothetical protein